MVCGECFGNQVIVDLSTQDNQLGIYFPVDGKLGIEYAEKNNLLRKKDESGKNIGGFIDEDKRNIKAIKLRGEKSDGLFMPLRSLSDFTDIDTLKEGDIITVLNGTVICEKYIPKCNPPKSSNTPNKKKSHKENLYKVTYPIFYEHADTEQLAYNINAFKPGDLCTITLKMHGTSGRTSYTLKKELRGSKLINSIKHTFKRPLNYKTEWGYADGTRRCILDSYDGGFYGSNKFREQHSKYFEGKLNKGETIYYEIVGYVDEKTPIMADCSNSKVNDKDFINQYGETTRFSYGCLPGESKAYVYRITMTNEDGYSVELPYEIMKLRCEQMGVNIVPKFETFFYTTPDDLMARVEKYYDGADPIGKTHIREGVVVRIENRDRFVAYKHKNFGFKVIEGIVKDTAAQPDIEEIQEVS